MLENGLCQNKCYFSQRLFLLLISDKLGCTIIEYCWFILAHCSVPPTDGAEGRSDKLPGLSESMASFSEVWWSQAVCGN